MDECFQVRPPEKMGERIETKERREKKRVWKEGTTTGAHDMLVDSTTKAE